ncbi:MAG: metallophosphoesterase [Gammaproteobacteria bacterium]
MKKIIFIICFFCFSQVFSASQLLTLTDIHYDALNLEKHYPGYRYETNNFLWQSTLNELRHLKTSGELHPSEILLLGDYYPHGIHQSKAYINDLLKSLINSVQNIFPETPIYITMGNHDNYGGNTLTVVDGDFLSNAAKIKHHVLDHDSIETFKHAGYYYRDLPNSNIRLITLNANLFSIRDPDRRQHVTDAKAQLQWLNEVLDEAKKLHRVAWVAMHIPPTINEYKRAKYSIKETFWQKDYLREFFRIIEKHRNNIQALFAGHVHTDGFSILSLPNNHQSVVFTSPSISPVVRNNPGIKVYDYEPVTGVLEDFRVYYLPLHKGSAAHWQLEYDFRNTYHVDLTTKGIIQLVNSQAFLSGPLGEEYRRFYAMQSPAFAYSPKKPSMKKERE